MVLYWDRVNPYIFNSIQLILVETQVKLMEGFYLKIKTVKEDQF